MDTAARNKLIVILLAALAIIIAAIYIPVPPSGTSGVHIVYSIASSQGAAANNTEMETVRINGTLSNDGDIPAENLNITVIFVDDAHHKVITNTVKEGENLLPDKKSIVEFATEYSRNRTFPKTEVKTILLIEWTEKGQAKIITEELFSQDVPSDVEPTDVEPTDVEPADVELAGTRWLLTLLNGSSMLESTTITLEFKDGRIGGNAGCNNYGSDYTSGDSGSITVDPIYITLRYCLPDDIMQHESQYVSNLRNVSSYSISGGLLTLSTDDGGELVFDRIR